MKQNDILGFMSDEQLTGRDAGAEELGGCQFPTGPGGATCNRPIERSGNPGPGRPARYCDLDGHTRVKAFTARRALERATLAGAANTAAEVDERIDSAHPVTGGQERFGALLQLFGDLADQAQRTVAAQQTQLAALLAEASEVARTVVDPDAASYEVEQVQRETAMKLAQAQGVQATAEREARDQRRRADTEAELRAQGDAAADHAVAELEAVRTQTAQDIARISEEAGERVAGYQHATQLAETQRADAVQRCEQGLAEAQEQIAQAHTAADRHRREVEDDRDRVLAERAAEAQQQIEETRREAGERVAQAEQAADTARREANTEILEVRRQLNEASTAHTRAEAERAAAERRATEERAAATQARAAIEQLRGQHHDELAAARREAADERAALRREATEQLTAVITRLEPSAQPVDTAEAEQDTDDGGQPRRKR